MKKIRVAPGIFWVEIPEADLRILCGCPADSVKHLRKMGLIVSQELGATACETGPNAILLSDVALQRGCFCNLGEFPILQMLYRQGMLLPDHPNNTGLRPLLIGTRQQVVAQAGYIYRGNYGLKSEEELARSGVSEQLARDIMRMKRRFAFDRILETQELIELRVVEAGPAALRGGATVERIGLNVYRFAYRGETLHVDLNLAPDEDYEASYQLGFHEVDREYFSVIYSGEGDGWDVNRPCMASVLAFQGKLYLIDAGPNLLASLRALGIGVNEIEGVFHTHSHDDHFNGLTVLIRSDHRIKYYAAPLVRHTAAKKLGALIPGGEDLFYRYFDIHDLQLDAWNNVGGLEVKPVLSPHPIETTIMFFRALWDAGHKSYAHFADVASMDVLRGMIADSGQQSGISADYFRLVAEQYAEPADIKKIDIGGGLIHGQAEDFRHDASGKIVLSHTSKALSGVQKEIGESATFGMVDVLIGADHDYSKKYAFASLCDYFPTAPGYELNMLMNCPVDTFNPGSILLKKGEPTGNIYLVLSGVLEFIIPELEICNIMTSGAMAGELSCMMDRAPRGTFRALSYVKTIRIPGTLYRAFLQRNGLFETVRQNVTLRWFLQQTWLFGERLSCPLKSTIAQNMQERTVVSGQEAAPGEERGIFLVAQGRLALAGGGVVVEQLAGGGFFGEETLSGDKHTVMTARALEDARLYFIAADVLADIPIVQWKLLETCERRQQQILAPAVQL